MMMDRGIMEGQCELQVSGMHCGSCAQRVSNRLEELGAQAVRVDLAEGRVRFRSENGLDLRSAASSIEKLGYQVHIPGSSSDGSTRERFPLEAKLVISALLTTPLIVSMVVNVPFVGHYLHTGPVQLLLTLPVFIIGLLHFGRSGVAAIKARSPNMDVLILIGFTSAYLYSLIGLVFGLGDNFLFFETSASIVTFVLLGNYMEHRSLSMTNTAVRELEEIRPVSAKRIVGDGESNEFIEVPLAQVREGDLLLVNSGDTIPLDGEVKWGSGYADESLITGESAPVKKDQASEVIGGSILVEGPIKVVVTRTGAETALSQIIRLVEEAQSEKPSIQKLGDRVSAYFVPAVLVIALATFVVSIGIGISLGGAMLRSIAVLVIACPCAMGLATPTAIVVGVGRAARSGILIRGGKYVELFSGVQKVVFDKTGIITTGEFKVTDIETYTGSEQEALAVIVGIEEHSTHPIARSILKQFPEHPRARFSSVQEEKGRGMIAQGEDGFEYRLGSYALAAEKAKDDNHSLYLLRNGELIAALTLEDSVRPEAADVISTLHKAGLKTALLSGDKASVCHRIAKQVGIEEVLAEQLPRDKLEYIQNAQKEQRVAFIGDGINDAPALSLAGVGVSLGGASQVAVTSSQIILLNGSLSELIEAIAISKGTMTTIKQNLFWAFFYNVLAIPLAAAGLLSPMIAAFAMAFSDVMVIGNSLRLRKRPLRLTGS